VDEVQFVAAEKTIFDGFNQFVGGAVGDGDSFL
jgi:hypothetical protein